jgi:hypothetical protein
LPIRPLDDPCPKLGLATDEVEMWAFLHHERLVILEWVRPYGLVRTCQQRGGGAGCCNLQSVSGAVGAEHRHLHMASIRPNLSLSGTYLHMSSRFWPPVPSTLHPSTSPCHGFVTVSSHPGSVAPGRAVYALALGNMAACMGCWG